jgi:hypothetical protein
MRKELMLMPTTVLLLIIDDFGMLKLPHTVAEDPLEFSGDQRTALRASQQPADFQSPSCWAGGFLTRRFSQPLGCHLIKLDVFDRVQENQ